MAVQMTSAQGWLFICYLGDKNAVALMSRVLGDGLVEGCRTEFPVPEVLALPYGILRRGYVSIGRAPEILGRPNVSILYLNPDFPAMKAMRPLNFEESQVALVTTAHVSQIEIIKRKGIDISAGYALFDGMGDRAPFVDFSRSLLITDGASMNAERTRSAATRMVRKFVFARGTVEMQAIREEPSMPLEVPAPHTDGDFAP